MKKETENAGRATAKESFPDVEKGTTPDPSQADGDEVQSKHETPQEASGVRSAPLTRTITGSSFNDPGPPPDGGTVAWVQALCAHFVIFNTWGFISSFGVFQTYYTASLGHPPSDISWVGSVQIFLLFFIGTASGRALDAGYYRPLYITGVLLQLFGVFMSSLCTKYWQLFLAQGICVGIAIGLQFCPTMGLLSTYFAKRRSLAIGIAASGSATGGLVFPVIVQQLLPKIGFGWTVRVIGFVMLFVGVLTATFLKPRLPPRKSGPLVEWNAFRETTYTLYCIAMFLNFWGLYFAFYYIGAYGRNILGISYKDSISLLLFMNGIGLPGRLIPNYLADRTFGPLNTIIPFAFVSGLMMYAWSGVHSQGGLWTFAALYGLSAAGIQALFPATLSSLTTDLKKAGTRMGMGFSIVSIASLTGPPLAGALIQLDHGGYLYAQMWGGSSLICGGLVLVAARIAKTGWTLKRKI